MSGLNIKELLSTRRKKNEIAKENAIPEFKQMIENAEKDEDIVRATSHMAKLVRQNLQSSTGNANDEVVFSHMRAFRDEMVDIDMPEIYNDFCKDLKKRIFNEEFGDQRNFWAAFKFQKLGLIRGTGDSEVTEQEAADFLKSG